ncbi:cytochrome b-c1 complex subunit 6-like [Neltuma alba]|uniref:cytochrome b-c1 complex subunit 6-like n=1 Tax=Neltuma alba TaxID=207710 RepID=UPI0010A47260|nr:cytochrome b-c1 complex subunit 6-like [Prosopis alba]
MASSFLGPKKSGERTVHMRRRQSLPRRLGIGTYQDHHLWVDEEPVDPKGYLEESCKPKCVKPLLEYQFNSSTSCVKRIQHDESGHKHCTRQYFDYWSCIDKCVSITL